MSEEEDHCIGEPQPGTDTIELYRGGRKLEEKTFKINKEQFRQRRRLVVRSCPRSCPRDLLGLIYIKPRSILS